MTIPWYQPGRFHVGSANYDPHVRSSFQLPAGNRVRIVDSTIRKLECSPGVRLSVDQKVDLALRAEGLGVAEIFINNVHFVAEYYDSACEIVARKTNLIVNVQTWLTSDWREGVDKAIATGADFAEVEARTSEVELLRLGLTREGMRERLIASLEHGRSRGARMVAGFMDSTRADQSYLLDLVDTALDHGATKLTFYDSFGVLSPEAVRFFIATVRSRIGPDVPIIIHLHDSFGLATAGAVAASTAGATHVDTAANGLPTNIPLARLEETVLALELLYGIQTGIVLERLYDYCRHVAMLSGIPLGLNKPVIGDHIFTFESDNDVAEQLRESTIENLKPFHPSVVGRTAAVVWDANTLRGDAVRAKLVAMGYEPTTAIVDAVLSCIRDRLRTMRTFPFWLQEDEVEQICREVVAA